MKNYDKTEFVMLLSENCYFLVLVSYSKTRIKSIINENVDTGGSGKSTFFKQLQEIHGNGFGDKERLQFKNHVFHQVIEQCKRLVLRANELVQESPEKYSNLQVLNLTFLTN